MSVTPNGLALGAAALALALGVYALLREPVPSPDVEARLDAALARIEDLERVAAPAPARGVEPPTLLGLDRLRLAETPAPDGTAARPDADAGPAGSASGEGTGAPPGRGTIEDLVQEAVDRKAAQMQLMQGNKKPPIELFAKTLGLTEDQRRAVEQEVVRSQHEIKAVLEIEAEDGTRFLDELVEVMARGMARPGQDPGRGQRLFGRLLSEEIPGSNETYAARVEGIKGRLREALRREWNAGQQAAFEAWQMDPTEIQGIPGSPWKDVETRVLERARALGADLPRAAD